MEDNIEERRTDEFPSIMARLDPKVMSGSREESLEHRIDRAAAVLNDPAYKNDFKVHVAYWILKGEPDNE